MEVGELKQLPKLSLVGLVAATLALCVPAASAAPAPGYEEFTGCPSRTVDTTIRFCVTSVVGDGHLKLGSKDTPIIDPISLVGATTTTGSFVLGSFDGGRQRVPGGLVGLTGLDWLSDVLGLEALKVYAESEVVGTPSNPAADPFVLRLKVKLVNPVLGNSCYVGSDTNPIVLNLTRGTTAPPPPNQPITGDPGTSVADPNLPNVIRNLGVKLVDNAFAAPSANGCRLQLGLLNVPINDLVNLQSGLPAPAGTNETVQLADAAVVRIQTVYPPLGLEQ
jgi:hypothetical protein